MILLVWAEKDGQTYQFTFYWVIDDKEFIDREELEKAKQYIADTSLDAWSENPLNGARF